MHTRLIPRANALKQLLPRASAQLECSLTLRTTTLSAKYLPNPAPKTLNGCKKFSTNPILLKKKTRADREREEESTEELMEVEDPYDLSTLQDGISKALDKLKNDLSKLRTGGRFNPEVLENLRVHLVKDSKASERLGDLAQVLPKGGRSLMILVGEKEHVKPIVSAIQGSRDLNLQPQPDAQNASQLNVPIPPPTKESRDLALAAASKAGETANLGIRNARGAMQKRLRAMELKKAVRPDDLKKAHKEMEKVAEKGVADAKKFVDAARKTMEQS
ncbi:ribosome recycling factor [Stipitochalara longipes BDJ]|nr:ribosome recycling factor [Stipitochalara longipes BDJ]